MKDLKGQHAFVLSIYIRETEKHRNTSRDRNRREINTKQIQRGRERELKRNSLKDKQCT